MLQWKSANTSSATLMPCDVYFSVLYGCGGGWSDVSLIEHNDEARGRWAPRFRSWRAREEQNVLANRLLLLGLPVQEMNCDTDLISWVVRISAAHTVDPILNAPSRLLFPVFARKSSAPASNVRGSWAYVIAAVTVVNSYLFVKQSFVCQVKCQRMSM